MLGTQVKQPIFSSVHQLTGPRIGADPGRINADDGGNDGNELRVWVTCTRVVPQNNAGNQLRLLRRFRRDPPKSAKIRGDLRTPAVPPFPDTTSFEMHVYVA